MIHMNTEDKIGQCLFYIGLHTFQKPNVEVSTISKVQIFS